MQCVGRIVVVHSLNGVSRRIRKDDTHTRVDVAAPTPRPQRRRSIRKWTGEIAELYETDLWPSNLWQCDSTSARCGRRTGGTTSASTCPGTKKEVERAQYVDATDAREFSGAEPPEMRATIRDVGIFREPSQLLYGSVMTQNEASR